MMAHTSALLVSVCVVDHFCGSSRLPSSHSFTLAIYIRYNAPVNHPVRARLGVFFVTSTGVLTRVVELKCGLTGCQHTLVNQ